jgi:TonB family protein
MPPKFSFCVLFVSLLAGSPGVVAQNRHYSNTEKRIMGSDTIIIEDPVGKTKGFRRVASAIEPRFIGDLNKYLIENQKPVNEGNIHGTVKVLFIISKTGKVASARIIKSLSPALDQEALRIVNSMPDWEPATIEGKPFDYSKIIELVF